MAASSTALVPWFDDQMLCAGCGVEKGKAPWGETKTILCPSSQKVIGVECIGNGCLACILTMVDGLRPTTTTWSQFAPTLAHPERMRVFQEWRSRRAGKPTNFTPAGVKYVTRCGTKITDVFDVHTPESITKRSGARATEIPELVWSNVPSGRDPDCTEAAVLTKKSVGRLEMYTITEAVFEESHLSADRHVRERQAKEIWQGLTTTHTVIMILSDG